VGEKRKTKGQPEGRSPIGRPRRRWEDNVQMWRGELEFFVFRIRKSDRLL
jgi:hypothetical protein